MGRRKKHNPFAKENSTTFTRVADGEDIAWVPTVRTEAEKRALIKHREVFEAILNVDEDEEFGDDGMPALEFDGNGEDEEEEGGDEALYRRQDYEFGEYGFGHDSYDYSQHFKPIREAFFVPAPPVDGGGAPAAAGGRKNLGGDDLQRSGIVIHASEEEARASKATRSGAGEAEEGGDDEGVDADGDIRVDDLLDRVKAEEEELSTLPAGELRELEEALAYPEEFEPLELDDEADLYAVVGGERDAEDAGARLDISYGSLDTDLDDSDEEGGGDFDDDDDDGDEEDSREKRQLDEEFEWLLEAYDLGDERQPDVDNDVDQPLTMLQVKDWLIQQAEDERTAHAERLRLRPISELFPEEEDKQQRIARLLELCEQWDISEEEEERQANEYIAALFARKERPEHDAVSIVSTYSNLDYHPGLVRPKKTRRELQQEKKKARIEISEKTGIPKHVLEQPQQPQQKKKTSSAKDREREEREERERKLEREALHTRKKGETLEEKRARKAKVKEERRLARERKKQLKVQYTAEERAIMHQQVHTAERGQNLIKY